MNSYFGSKGYTITKESISREQLNFIKNDLIAKPYIPKCQAASGTQFPIYRESPNKIYIPKHYGLQKFGEPTQISHSHHTSIDIQFNGSLRQYQYEITNSFFENVNQGGYGGLFEVGCGQGKTVMALHVISKLKLKTLIIVHKEFLMNQWIERIEQFLPGCRVGKIQGQIIDIDDKDIVIGMLQSLAMKEYPSQVFDSFGFTVIDETHHIAAEVFVRSLFKITTKYMLGLSATMNRKDGLTKVFKMFIGDILYKYVDKTDHNVLVNMFHFHRNDDEYDDTILSVRGDPLYSSMISKISSYTPRILFIISLIEKVFQDNPNQQMIVLSHNKSLLMDLSQIVKERCIANSSVGFYVGGMKEVDLKMSESKSIIMATYAMAAEALDIKTLSCLLMASPKTDVTQSIGRILRIKRDQPLVLDIVDQHEIFVSQSKKRISYYKKQNYIIHNYKENDIVNFEIMQTKSSKKQQPVKCLL